MTKEYHDACWIKFKDDAKCFSQFNNERRTHHTKMANMRRQQKVSKNPAIRQNAAALAAAQATQSVYKPIFPGVRVLGDKEYMEANFPEVNPDTYLHVPLGTEVDKMSPRERAVYRNAGSRYSIHSSGKKQEDEMTEWMGGSKGAEYSTVGTSFTAQHARFDEYEREQNLREYNSQHHVQHKQGTSMDFGDGSSFWKGLFFMGAVVMTMVFVKAYRNKQETGMWFSDTLAAARGYI